MYWQKNIGCVRFGVCLIITGVILFVVGLFVQQYHEFSSTPEGYIRDVSYPFYTLGIGLIVVSGVLFIIGFYCIVKDKIPL